MTGADPASILPAMSHRTSLALALVALAVGGCKDRTPGQPTNRPSGAPAGNAAAAPTAPTPVAPTPIGGTPMGPSGPRPTIDLPSVATVSTQAGAFAPPDLAGDPGALAGSAAPPAVIPSVAIGPVAGEGVFDAAAIGNVLAAARPAFERCYADALSVRPGVAGQLVLSIALSETGAPTATNATGVDPGVADCIAAAVHKLAFPAPNGLARVTSTLTLSVAPTP